MSWQSEHQRVVVIGDERLLARGTVAVRGLLDSPAAHGVLHVGASRTPVEVLFDARIQADMIVVADGLLDDPASPWRLDVAATVPIRRLVLRAQMDVTGFGSTDLDALSGLALLAGPGGEVDGHVEVRGEPCTVVRVEGVADGALGVVVEGTQVSLHIPGTRTGVDIVVLADCSGSMSIPDIEVGMEPRSGFWGRTGTPATIERMDAVQRALERLLDARMEVDGRVSRFAMLEFTHITRVRFPVGGGMADVDASTPAAISQFRQAISLLRPQNAGTDIGQAIHSAAELLYTHGHPSNEKLIVLVSDGAEWAPKGAEFTGETLSAIDEPVSLMEHYHHAMGVRIHCIGVSDPEMYDRYFRARARPGDRKHPSSVPNHELLENLIAVGGGDPSHIGGMDVLYEYFGGLGAGRTIELGKVPAGRRSGGVPAELISFLKEQARSRLDPEDERRRDDLAVVIRQLYSTINFAAETYPKREPLFRLENRAMDFLMHGIDTSVHDEDSFTAWLLRFQQVLWESVDKRVLHRMHPCTPVNEIMHREGNDAVHVLRNHAAHLKSRRPDAVGDVMHRLTGRRVLGREDGKGWATLQLAFLDQWADLMRELADALASHPPDPDAVPTAATFEFIP
jgi:hypothetical protein